MIRINEKLHQFNRILKSQMKYWPLAYCVLISIEFCAEHNFRQYLCGWLIGSVWYTIKMKDAQHDFNFDKTKKKSIYIEVGSAIMKMAPTGKIALNNLPRYCVHASRVCLCNTQSIRIKSNENKWHCVPESIICKCK